MRLCLMLMTAGRWCQLNPSLHLFLLLFLLFFNPFSPSYRSIPPTSPMEPPPSPSILSCLSPLYYSPPFPFFACHPDIPSTFPSTLFYTLLHLLAPVLLLLLFPAPPSVLLPLPLLIFVLFVILLFLLYTLGHLLVHVLSPSPLPLFLPLLFFLFLCLSLFSSSSYCSYSVPNPLQFEVLLVSLSFFYCISFYFFWRLFLLLVVLMFGWAWWSLGPRAKEMFGSSSRPETNRLVCHRLSFHADLLTINTTDRPTHPHINIPYYIHIQCHTWQGEIVIFSYYYSSSILIFHQLRLSLLFTFNPRRVG